MGVLRNILLVAGILLVLASNWMVNFVDRAAIPDAMDRWGPDGYSHLHAPFLLFGSLGVLVISGIIEVLVLSVSEEGFRAKRWFAVFSIALFFFGCFAVWSDWDVWIEARNCSEN